MHFIPSYCWWMFQILWVDLFTLILSNEIQSVANQKHTWSCTIYLLKGLNNHKAKMNSLSHFVDVLVPFTIKLFTDLKAHSLMLNRGHSQNFWNVNFFAFLWCTSPKELGWINFSMKWEQFSQKSLGHETLFNTVIYGSNEIHIYHT